MKNYYVYMMANFTNTTLYTGVTSDLEKRVFEHKNGVYGGFTKKYNCKKLVYFEVYSDPENAIIREKQIKGWKRFKKNALVDLKNPSWVDLSECAFQFPADSSSHDPQNNRMPHHPERSESFA